MIYYPLSLLIASGISDIVLVSTPREIQSFQRLLGDVARWGVSIQYAIQDQPRSLPEVFSIADKYTTGHSTTFKLGDNIFYGSKIASKLQASQKSQGAAIYGDLVNDVSSFWNVVLDESGRISELREKPDGAGRGLAVPGIYHVDETEPQPSRELKPSNRVELEIVDLLNSCLIEGSLTCELIYRGMAWLDTGTIDDLNANTELVRVVHSPRGILIGWPEEVAYRKGWISSIELELLASEYKNSKYGSYLFELVSNNE
jgi:glucose-1-phosphate thymidylyltransferase